MIFKGFDIAKNAYNIFLLFAFFQSHNFDTLLEIQFSQIISCNTLSLQYRAQFLLMLMPFLLPYTTFFVIPKGF